MVEKFKKYLSILTIVALMFLQVGPNIALAAPSVPEAPSAPSTPAQPEAPSAPSSDPAPSAPSAPTYEQASNDNDEPQEEVEQEPEQEQQSSTETSAQAQDNNTSSPSPSPTTSGNQTGNQNGDGQVGDNSIGTGDATNNANLVTNANNNLGAIGGEACCEGGASVVNSDNGTGSTNSGSLNSANTTQTFQENSARVANDLNQSTTTGDNSASDNTGGDSAITTGDANTTGTIISAVNTNVAGVAVAEFNIADDHTGDYILDFGTGCIVNCQGGALSAVNSGNGSDSTNDASIDDINSNQTFQTNEADIFNTMDLASNSGGNTASRNTGGDSTIETGDANVAANVLTFANNNFAGNVVYGVVNIFGDLIGDIIFPESAMNCSNCGGDLAVANTGNGTNTNNNANINTSNTNDLFQINDANIENNLIIDGQTGENNANANTNGDTFVDTGNIDIAAQVLNVANSNIAGDWWLVIVNEAGNWVGKIMGAPEGANFAGSAGTEFAVNENGDITAVNSGNGSSSSNDANVNSETNNSLTQTNDANIVNNVKLSANTGGNSTTDNTGGSNRINTGDANIVANMVNFVNNNIAGSGRLFVTVVNVFGSWTGNLVTPGQKKEEVAQVNNQPSGGTEQNQDSSNNLTNTENNNPTNNSNQGGNNAGTTANTNKAAGNSNNSGANVNVSSSGNGSTSLVLGESTDTQVAGFKAEASEGEAGAVDSKKVLRINLAYLILLLPFIGGFLIFKKRSQLMALLSKKNKT